MDKEREVKRWYCVAQEDNILEEDKDGDYVKYYDWQAERAKREEAEKDNRIKVEMINELQDKVIELEKNALLDMKEINTANKKAEKLEAEAKAVRSKTIEEIVTIIEGSNNWAIEDVVKAIRALNNEKE